MTQARGLQIGVVVALAIAAIGLVSGVRTTGRRVSTYIAERPPPVPASEARAYGDMRDRMYGPNAELQAAWWGMLPAVDPFVPVVQTTADLDAARMRRASRRAYDGAPPTIPHAIDHQAAPACLTCHEHGLVVAKLVAPRMSHGPMGSCVQCHVVAADPRPGVTTPPSPETTFVGTGPPRRGQRAWQGAPPTIPHPTWMRERCESCHGVYGAPGMKTTHPWRQSCTQCHVPSAVLDQRVPIANLGAAP